jgi:hypothetical protein
MAITRVFPVFSAAFGVIYVPAMNFNWPVFTYVPRTREFHPFLFAPVGNLGPGMYYWGWLLTAAIGAAIISAAAALVPERMAARVSVAWVPVFPICCVVVLLYILRTWFIQS